MGWVAVFLMGYWLLVWARIVSGLGEHQTFVRRQEDF